MIRVSMISLRVPENESWESRQGFGAFGREIARDIQSTLWPNA
jgi:hypothetical protein